MKTKYELAASKAAQALDSLYAFWQNHYCVKNPNWGHKRIHREAKLATLGFAKWFISGSEIK